MDEVAAEAGNVKVVRQSFRGTHGDSSHILSTVVLSNENQTCRGGEDVTMRCNVCKYVLDKMYVAILRNDFSNML